VVARGSVGRCDDDDGDDVTSSLVVVAAAAVNCKADVLPS